ncbi:Proline-rich receptor-like protein kinase [Actinidia chinensis var. chinensis]|uniref:Proline-rich receptor-like protein kinase n=1 Tax=Actinidia chinensis var. chinensis TaxID=1590841 RepID=A0A2R6Q855_ACTCC|nr:Proline-rich receptor-like protein kinase [Actinidia chinensis var. chinensis]
MAATNTTTQAVEPPPAAATADEVAARAVHKRYEGLVMVRTKAIKGKGAWYWAHLEPMLVHNSDSGLPKAVKLRCSLCDALFSASNPSRTASEHLKRGTCPNFSSAPKPISSVSPSSMPGLTSPSSSTQIHHNHRKRSSSSARGGGSAGGSGVSSSSFQVPPLAIVDPSRFSVELAYPPAVSVATVVTAAAAIGGGGSGGCLYAQPPSQHLMLSGGKEDLCALAMLEDSVKKLKSPKASPGPTLSKTQIDSALDFLADWVYESCGSVSFSSLEHPKFRAFLSQVGLPPVSRRELAGGRLDAKYEEAKAETEAKIHDAMFFQVSSDGWKSKNSMEENLVNLGVNLPNGTSVFRRAVFTSGSVPSKYAEEVLWDTIRDICGNVVQQCVGIVSDKFKAKALRSLESQHHWMVNLACQLQGITSLIKDFSKELPLFKNVTDKCLKLVNFVNNKSQIRNAFHKYQLQEYGQTGLLRVPLNNHENSNFGPMVEDVLSSARAFQLVLLDESFKIVSMEEQIAREIEDMMRDPKFWNELEAVHSLVKLIKGMAQEVERDRPLVGQCIPLWDEIRVKVKEWCSRFHIAENPVDKVIDKRFQKNYHPAWAAAFILDPLYLIRDASGKYLPPFKCLTPEQEKDVDKLITRLVSREEAHIALMELMKWRTEGLDPVYAQAVQLKQRDPVTGKMKIANPQSSRLVWETHLTQFKSLGKVAVRLIFLHATSCGFKCNWSFLRWVSAHGHSRVGLDRAQKLVFIAAHSKLERRDFSTDEEKDAELFALANGEDDELHDVFY